MTPTPDWKERFRKREWKHWHSKSSSFERLPDSTKEEIIKFISSEKEASYREGYEKGVLEESIGCYDHSKEAIDSYKQKILEEVEKMKLVRDYDGNNLQEACEKYCIGAETWIEIIRYENGYTAALYDLKERIGNL